MFDEKKSGSFLASLYIVSLLAGCAFNNIDAASLKAPEVVSNDDLPGNIKTTWTCVYFGSYPTCEIVNSKFSAVDDYAVSDGDVIYDPSFMQSLKLPNGRTMKQRSRVKSTDGLNVKTIRKRIESSITTGMTTVTIIFGMSRSNGV